MENNEKIIDYTTRIVYIIIISIVISCVFTSFAYSLTEEEKLKQAQQQAQSIIRQSGGGNSGESIFKGKQDRDSTIKDFANSSIKITPNQNEINSYQNPQYQNNYNQVANNIAELDEKQIALIKSAMRNKNLRAVQQKFLNKNYKGTENTVQHTYKENKTQVINTRFAMATTLIFEKNIDSYIVGDSTGFQVEGLPNMKNALAIKPLLIGIDTSLTVFTKDNKLHTFFVYSTDYKSVKNPNLIVYIKEEEKPKAPENVIIYDEKDEELKNYLIIKEGIAEVKVKKDEIYEQYIQKSLEKNKWLMAEEIFNDKQFTYFKYDKDKLPQIPAIFTVTDRQDSPIETRVIGNYVIVETVAPKFTIRIGESYVCVEKLSPENLKKFFTNEELKEINQEEIIEKFKKPEPKTKVQIIDGYEVSKYDEYGNERKDIEIFHEEKNRGKELDLNQLFNLNNNLGKTTTKVNGQ
ncbi:TrbG/VirB9 family P-type conjugative transfer protein [Campylobacter troglodytis]|uniref:TrbG/VirB9 family P-type conjugative transfer protein n=1 Tax=Campylobacter troglodytis TaxID=654363 RepID=UPI00115769AE|nr:TrbG/VirB9 family P-type conjugative transfer protein [Campylobacter troglodytis]TQR56265.1 type IV secretion system protein VirB9 [Campylobacter troglodytis]